MANVEAFTHGTLFNYRNSCDHFSKKDKIYFLAFIFTLKVFLLRNINFFILSIVLKTLNFKNKKHTFNSLENFSQLKRGCTCIITKAKSTKNTFNLSS